MTANTSREAVVRLADQHIARARWGAAGYEQAARCTTVESLFHNRTADTLRALLARAENAEAERDALRAAARNVLPHLCAHPSATLRQIRADEENLRAALTLYPGDST